MQNEIDRDLYDILGVGQGASAGEIKSAYRSKAHECHPDVAHHDPDGEHKFKELSFAYEILSDPEKRRTYDNLGLDGLKRGAGIDFDGFGSISDLFDVFFGEGFGSGFGSPGRRRPQRRGRQSGRDMEMLVVVSLADVLDGAEKEVDLTRMATCSDCDGSGMKPGSQMSRCSACQGTGEVRRTQRNIFGTFIRAQVCSTCMGAGEVITDPCSGCGGVGRRSLTEKLQVSVPPGVERGDRLRVREKGEGGVRGGANGDLYVVIDVAGDPRFQRDGTRLYSRATVEMVDAALGAEIAVGSIDGEFSLKVPAGTQHGDVLKARGKGLPPRYGGKRGDMSVVVDVKVPRKLTAEQKKLLESYRQAGKERARK
ncbi:MAG TPA: molecular chaperone DnaJ [Candidatus Anoxymicrobiaceae bacterium]